MSLARLPEAVPHIPIDEQYDIPIRVFHRSFDTRVLPDLADIGDGLLRPTLDEPFGFFTSTTGGLTRRSQKIEDIVLGETSYAGKWIATVRSPHQLTDIDFQLIGKGVSAYTSIVYQKLL